jgi:NADH:ubiquinone oxidoreductase subunit 4 (subunit M)
LPEAHVEAPTVGSVILASLLLKLGGYGIIRFLLLTLSASVNYYFLNIYLIIALLSCIYTTFIAARQVDIKKIIAYSSIAHMNLTLLGLFSNSVIGVTGAVSLMLAHGFVSGALFFSIGMLYSRFNTRLLKYYNGVTSVLPKLSIFFLFFSFANIGFPCTYNFIGELLILLGFFLNTAVSVGLLLGISFILSLVYSI